MEKLINELKEVSYKVVQKQLRLELNNFSSSGRVFNMLLSDDRTNFSNNDQEAFIVWEAYNKVISALYNATEKLEQAVEIENGFNSINK